MIFTIRLFSFTTVTVGNKINKPLASDITIQHTNHLNGFINYMIATQQPHKYSDRERVTKICHFLISKLSSVRS